jgi:hypothetical protein
MKRYLPIAFVFSVAVIGAGWCVSYNHISLVGRQQTGAGSANIVVSVSDPAICAPPSGSYAHIYVTFTDVAASASALDSANHLSFVDLTPGLSAHPRQIDLLGSPDGKCFLAILGGGVVAAGIYRGLRVSLLQGTSGLASIPGGNHCEAASSSTANCVVMSSGQIFPLAVPPSGWFDIGPEGMPSGELSFRPNETTPLNLSLDGCDSLVPGIGTSSVYFFEASARAAVLDEPTTIGGRIVDAATRKAIAGRVVIATEQKDATGIDRIVMETTAASDGSFTLCPVPKGSYDLAIAAVSSDGVAYAPTMLLGVPAGATTGQVDLERAGGTNASPGTILGQVSLLAGTATGFGSVNISLLASGGPRGYGVTFTVPLLNDASGTIRVKGPGSIMYSIAVPAANPRVGLFSSVRMSFSQETSWPAEFTVEARACGSTSATASPVSVTAGGIVWASVSPISSCSPAASP